jgi:hypothetical protein
MANKDKFFNAGLPKNIEQAIDAASKEAAIGRAKYHLLNGLSVHKIQFDPSTVKLAVVDIHGVAHVTASVIIPLNNDFGLGVEYFEYQERYRVWVQDKNGKVCEVGDESISYDYDSLSYCLAMCFSWLYLGGCNE